MSEFSYLKKKFFALRYFDFCAFDESMIQDPVLQTMQKFSSKYYAYIYLLVDHVSYPNEIFQNVL